MNIIETIEKEKLSIVSLINSNELLVIIEIIRSKYKLDSTIDNNLLNLVNREFNSNYTLIDLFNCYDSNIELDKEDLELQYKNLGLW